LIDSGTSGKILVGAYALLVMTGYQNTFASISPTIGNMSESIMLEKPFFVERYTNSTIEPQDENVTFTTTGSGNGILNGTVRVETYANATITFRNNETIFLEGDAKYVTADGDIASYMFLELGKINPDLTYSGSGIGIFDDEATGELASLSNMVAVYKSQIDNNGNATVYYYEWT
jgi:hypothetical protein